MNSSATNATITACGHGKPPGVAGFPPTFSVEMRCGVASVNPSEIRALHVPADGNSTLAT